MLIGRRDYRCIPLDKHRSTSGRFEIFLGQHYHQGVICYIVGAYDERTGVLTARHYSVKTGRYVSDETAKASALIAWDEFREKMLAPAAPEENEQDPSRYFRTEGT